MIGELDHIDIQAADAEAMVSFLKVLGYTVEATSDHHGTSYELVPQNSNGPLVEIHQVSEGKTPGINHLAFSVDDIEETIATLEERGLDNISDPKYVEVTGRTLANFRDPDGRRYQLVESE